LVYEDFLFWPKIFEFYSILVFGAILKFRETKSFIFNHF
jgi:hypothetical protein